jgi:hypothetical protein
MSQGVVIWSHNVSELRTAFSGLADVFPWKVSRQSCVSHLRYLLFWSSLFIHCFWWSSVEDSSRLCSAAAHGDFLSAFDTEEKTRDAKKEHSRFASQPASQLLHQVTFSLTVDLVPMTKKRER